MKTLLRCLCTFAFVCLGDLRAGNLTVTLAPSQAVSAGAKWRVDGGNWKNSGATVNNLSNTTHTVEFRPVTGWLTPATTTVSITAGNTTSLTTTYVRPASLSITLTPSTGQWRIDGGTWRASGTTATGLTPGNHTIDYSALAGYASPATETVTLVSNQTTTLARSYTQLSQLKITLTPTSGQWRVDGGAWQASDATVSNLLPGTHTVDYNAVSGYAAPAFESVTLTSGQLTTLSRSYVQLAQLTVTLTPSSAQWCVDGGAWLASGATAADLAPGAHTIDYQPVTGYLAPSSETVTLAGGPTSLSRNYTALARVTVTLTPANAQWRIDGGVWLASGTTAENLFLGAHTINYSSVPGYVTPPSEPVTLASGDNPPITRIYATLPTLTVNLTPAAANAQWRVDQGSWNVSGATVVGLALGSHSVEYAPRWGYLAPSVENVDLVAGETRVLTRAYLTAPGYAIIKTLADAGSKASVVRGTDGVLYIATSTGGGNDGGQIFRVNADGTGYAVLKSFIGGTTAIRMPISLIQASDGALYGTTQSDSVVGTSGTIFKINTDGSGFTILRSFGTSSAYPNALVEASDGLLYGTTANGSGYGNLFRIAKDGSGYWSVGQAFGRGRVEGPDGFLYGATSTNAFATFGSVFKCRKDGTGFVVLKNFDNSTADGASPASPPIVGSDGVLYGTTSAGGMSNKGVIYRLNLDGTGFTVLRNFLGDATDGGRLDASLTEGPGGVLYGATYGGGSANRGTVFKMNKDGTGYTILRHFLGSTTDGGINNQPVIVAPDGTLFSANRFSGGDNVGLVFKMNSDGSGFALVRQLGAPEGAMPRWVTEASDGALYGITYRGGGSGYGAVFKLNKDGSGFSVLHGFAVTNDGYWGQGQILEARDGMLYGTTIGGNPSSGVLFRVAKDGTGYAILHGFGGTGDGWGPGSGVIEGADGTLYGTTLAGGNLGGYGAIYRINKDGSGHTILRSFANLSVEGNSPAAALLEAPNGLLYGTMSSGGNANAGTLFSIAKDGTGYTVLHHFVGDATDGSGSWAKLLLGTDGRLYGTTNGGGAGSKGTIFGLNLDGTGYVVLKHFTGGTSDGAGPAYAGVLEKNGALYGVTQNGGTFDSGTLYGLNKDGTGFTILINFGVDDADGRLPAFSLIKTSDGAFYGAAVYGGNGGTVYRFGIN